MTIRIASLRPAAPAYQDVETLPLETRLEPALYLLDEAGRAGADVACLPEDFLFQQKQAETLDGPICTALADKARTYRMNVAAGIKLREAGHNYNTTVIFDREGQLAGRYHKTHLIKVERETFGLTAGDSLPVFQLDFGCVGVMTCSDILFPEVARVLALQGAELILFPHQMAEPDEAFFATMVRSRAQDNCVPIVCSTFADEPERHWFRNWIVGSNGAILAEGPLGSGMTLLDLDIGRRVELTDYIEMGPVELWEIIRKYRRPDLYERIGQT